MKKLTKAILVAILVLAAGYETFKEPQDDTVWFDLNVVGYPCVTLGRQQIIDSGELYNTVAGGCFPMGRSILFGFLTTLLLAWRNGAKIISRLPKRAWRLYLPQQSRKCAGMESGGGPVTSVSCSPEKV